ncbi:MAG: glycosyltransferase, partial [Rhodothermales bacterium]
MSNGAAPRRRVLVVAPDFAPSSYPPALRIRFFARHLPEFGWEPTVLAIDPAYYEWDVDPENEALLSDDLHVVRCPALPASVTRSVGLGDLSARGLVHLWRAIRRLTSERRYDLLFLSVPPYYQALLGRWAYERLGIPYVVDYIDPWVSDYWKREPGASRFSKRAASAALAKKLEPICLRKAAHVTGVSKGTTDEIVARYDWLTPADATEIPYGGEPSDFDYLRTSPRKNPIFDPHDGSVHLSYVGRGGADMVPALRAVFAAVREGLEQSPDVFGRLRLHFVGTTYAPDGEGRYQVLPVAEEEGVAHL